MDISWGQIKPGRLRQEAGPVVQLMAGDWRLAPASNLLRVLLLTSLLAIGTALVYGTGGTAYAYPYLMLIPVLFAAAWYGLAGGLLTALVAAGLMAAMPLDVDAGTPQATFNWLLRMALYAVLGGVSGWLFQSLARAFGEQQRLMRIDPRSNLPNVVALDEDLHHWTDSEDPTQPLALIIVRITDIVDVLETMGGDASDDMATALARRLRYLVEPRGRVYRFSMSELAVLLPGVDQAGLLRTVERIIEVGEDNLLVRGLPVRAQLALGSTSKDTTQSGTDTLVKEARLALFAAMERGLSHCRYRPELSEKTLDTLRLIANVRRGLERREFELHYQPKVALSESQPIASEALLRWRDREQGLIGPGQFMPKLETTSLMTQVTRFVCREACEFAARSNARVSINFSAHDLVDESMPGYIQGLVRELQMDSARLEVEVTESALIRNLEAARRAVENFRELGLGVSIDDFGTGFASFEYLRHLPITGIKIDRAFVCDLEADVRARKLMACMVDMGHALDLTVTAEGVETLEQYRILQALGCDQAQGFYFSKALPAPGFNTWVAGFSPGPDLLEVPASRDFYGCGLAGGSDSRRSG